MGSTRRRISLGMALAMGLATSATLAAPPGLGGNGASPTASAGSTAAAATRPADPAYQLTAQQGQALLQLHAQAQQQMQAGQYADALATLDKAAAIVRNNPGIDYNRACANARLGQQDKAMDLLSKAIGEGFTDAGQIAGDEDLASLHANPQFAVLIKKAADAPSMQSRFPYEGGADIDGVKTVERDPHDGLRYRIRMSPDAAADKPARLVVWLHPSGNSYNRRIEGLAKSLNDHHVALMVFTQKDFEGWTQDDMHRMVRSISDAGKIPGIDADRPLVIGFSAGGYLAMIMYQENPRFFGGLAFDSAYPVNMMAQPNVEYTEPPSDPIVKRVPILAIVGANDPGTKYWEGVEDNWKAAGAPLKVMEVANRGHEWLLDNTSRREALLGWVDQVLAGEVASSQAAPTSQPAPEQQAIDRADPQKMQALIESLSQEAARLMADQQWKQALGVLDQISTVSPKDPEVDYNRACCQARLGDKKDAIATLSQSVDEGFAQADHIAQDDDLASLHDDPKFNNIVTRSRNIPVAALSPQEKEIRAQTEYQQMTQQTAHGDWEDALKTNDDLIALAPKNTDIAYERACILARLAKTKEALPALSHAIDLGYAFADHIKTDEDLASLHGNPEFDKLVARAAKVENDYTRFPLEKGADIPSVKTIEDNPGPDAMAYRLRMSKDATPDRPDRLVVWFHPSGGSMDNVVEALAPQLAKHHLALVVFPQKQYLFWYDVDVAHLNKTLEAIAKIPGIDAKHPLAVGFSAGGQMMLQLYALHPADFGGMVLDSAYPIKQIAGGYALLTPPKDPAVKTVPILAIVGDADANGRIWTQAEDAWKDAGVPLTLDVVPNGHHQWLFTTPVQKQRLVKWLSDVAAGNLPGQAAAQTQPATQPAY